MENDKAKEVPAPEHHSPSGAVCVSVGVRGAAQPVRELGMYLCLFIILSLNLANWTRRC